MQLLRRQPTSPDWWSSQSSLTDRPFYKSDFVLQNTRETAALAHFGVPDCAGTKVFINLSDNTHLDTAYGGFCVFAQVDDPSSFLTMDVIAAAIQENGKVGILQIKLMQ
jgi:cyclophilin family peptidyl-prolyl cis-trans isomerase